MLSKNYLLEIREQLEKAQNPVFFYDNDADGFCSYVLFRRFLGRGKGVVIKSYPDLQGSYIRKVHELKADAVFVLDKPLINEEFFKEIETLQIPLVWVDHHDIEAIVPKSPFVNYYNPTRNGGKNLPVTTIAYNVTQRKEDIWIAMMGSIADHHLPDFTKEFGEKFPDLWKIGIKDPFEAYFNTDIGHLAQSIAFGLKDTFTHVVALQNFFINCANPSLVFEETTGNSAFLAKYKEIKSKYQDLINQARSVVHDKIIYFEYGGDLSMSSEIANELIHIYPKHFVAVVYTKGHIVNISLRGKSAAKILQKVLKSFEGASGGGHDEAVGARIRSSDLGAFQELLKKEIS